MQIKRHYLRRRGRKALEKDSERHRVSQTNGSAVQTFFAGCAVSLTVVAATLYLLGHLYLERLFSPFSLTGLVVGLDFHELVYEGWFAFVLWLGGVLDGKKQALLPAILLFAYFIAIALSVYLTNYPDSGKPGSLKPPSRHLMRAIRLDRKTKGFLSGSLVSLLLSAGVWSVLLAVVLFLYPLVLIGRYSAESSLAVQKVVERNSSGKLVPVSGWTPNTLFVLDEGKEVTGFLLFSTRNSYAIVDSATGRGRVINSQLVKYVEPIEEILREQ